MKRAHRRAVIAVGAVAAAGGLYAWWQSFPPDTTPSGAYLRIAAAIGDGEPRGCFAYLEEDAQRSCYTILDYARQATARIESAYPPDARADALAPYEPITEAGDPRGVWLLYARKHGWIQRLRGDLSGIDEVDIEGDRASVVTARGTRYPFRRRPNGIWGLTIFTAELVAEAEKLARDWDLIQKAAADYEREAQASG